MKAKKILVIADLHCGHRAGLTPPAWQTKFLMKHSAASSYHRERQKFVAQQKECWQYYIKETRRHGPYDIVIVNGDSIEGKDVRSGGTELVASDLQEQAEMAEHCIYEVLDDNTKLIMIYGTAYHVTNNGDDVERMIARNLNAIKIGSHEWLEVNGVCMDIKHDIGGSQVPTSVPALKRAWVQNRLWAIHQEQPEADILIRSHAHEYTAIQTDHFTGIVTPALQAAGTKFGARKCEGHVSFGFIVIDINAKGEYGWTKVIARLPSQKAHSLVL